MKRWIRFLVVGLLVGPAILPLAALGVLYLWEHPRLVYWSWIPFVVGWGAAWFVLRRARRRGPVLWQPEAGVAPHWTARDEAAWQKVRSWADRAGSIEPQAFFTTRLYLETAQEMAGAMAEHYHGTCERPWDHVTLPEILTAVELALSDVRQFIETHVPGSHVVTLRWLRRAARLPQKWKKYRVLYDVASVLVNPWSALFRTVSRQAVSQPLVGELERDAFAALYQVYVLSVGKYLIELYSGRLRGGPDAWRSWLAGASGPPSTATSTTASVPPDHTEASPADDAGKIPHGELSIAVVGQSKAGKSSLVRELLGPHQVDVDEQPSDNGIRRYRLKRLETDAALILFDTPGYGGEGAGGERFDKIVDVVREASAVILVMHACQPAREPDRKLLEALDDWYRQHPHEKRPPVLIALTHIDLLPPALEWDPPYEDWLLDSPARTKARQIRDAVCAVRASLGEGVRGVVPVCAAPEEDRRWGLEEELVPALVAALPEAKAGVLLRSLHDQIDQRGLGTWWSQLRRAGRLILRAGTGASWAETLEPSHRSRSTRDA